MRTLLLALVVALLTAPARGQGYICAEGGGAFGSGDWSIPVVGWMVEKGQKGPVVILGAPVEGAGGADHLAARFKAAGAASVTDLRIGKEDADTPETEQAIAAASIVFIRGGAQSRYVMWWRGTRTESAIRAVFDRGGVVGGTSAGCAVLGEVIYDALNGSLASRDILRDARHKDLTLTQSFLGLTPGVLFDTHFTERGRLARAAVMLARAREDFKKDVAVIGMDTRTALCIDPEGRAMVMGSGSATILRATPATRTVLLDGHPPVVTEIAYTQLVAGHGYDLRKAGVTARPDQSASDDGDKEMVFAPLLQAGRIRGHELADSDAGSLLIDDGGSPRSLINGALRLSKGRGMWGYCVVQTRTWDDRESIENRVGGLQWALTRRPGWLAAWLTTGCDAWLDDRANIRIGIPDETDAATAPSAMLILDSEGVRHVTCSVAMSGDESEGPRQSAAIEEARLHVLAPGWGYSPARPGTTADHERGRAIPPQELNR